MRPPVPGGDRGNGGIVSYPLDKLYEEVAFIAYYFHWPIQDILTLEHGDRQRFIDEISDINRQMNEASAPAKGIPLQDWGF